MPVGCLDEDLIRVIGDHPLPGREISDGPDTPQQEPGVPPALWRQTMSHNRLTLITGVAACLLFVSCGSPGNTDRFLPSTDLNLILEAPIDRWDEAIPLGNGIMGGLLWGSSDTLRLSLDRGDLWDLRIPERFSEADFTWSEMKQLVDAHDQEALQRRFDSFYNVLKYPTKLPGGRLEIILDPVQQAESFELDLAAATGRVYLNTGRLIEGFYSAVEPVALFRIPGPRPREMRLFAPSAVRQLGYPEATKGSTDGEYWYLQETTGGLRYAVLVATRRAGDCTFIALTCTAARDGSDLLDRARRIVGKALDSGWGPLYRSHREYWTDFWSQSRLSVPDLNHLRHYYRVQYYYGAASRQGAPSMPLQGVWTADDGQLPPWKGDYHHDLNTQMTYDAYQTAGRFEAGACFLDHMYRLLPRFRQFAAHFYEAPGAAIPSVMTQEGDPMTGWVMYSLSPSNGAWVGWLFYKHWLYTRDEGDLQHGYAFCSELGECLRHLLNEDEDGRLKLPLSSSPEIFDNTLRAFLEPNSNYDRDCMEALFRGLAHMAREIGRSEEAERWQRTAEMLGPRAVDDEDILMFSSEERMLQSHRHFSQSMSIHPFDLMTVDDGRDREIIEATVRQYDHLGTAWWCGYSFSWMACLRARIGDPEAALHYLDIYEKAFISRNGFHLNGDQLKTGYSRFQYRPFTLEGNFLAAQAVHEMLLQSWHGVVRIFPATPERWRDASFEDLRAEGGFRVSARRENHQTTWIRIGATVDGTLRVLDNFSGRNPRWNRSNVRREGDCFVLDMQSGEILEGRFR